MEIQALLNGDEPKALPKLSCGNVSEPDLRRLALPLVGVSRLAAEEAVCRRVGRVEGVVGYAGDNAEVRTGVEVVEVAGTGGGDVSAEEKRFMESGRLDGMVLRVSPRRSQFRHSPCSRPPIPSRNTSQLRFFYDVDKRCHPHFILHYFTRPFGKSCRRCWRGRPAFPTSSIPRMVR